MSSLQQDLATAREHVRDDHAFMVALVAGEHGERTQQLARDVAYDDLTRDLEAVALADLVLQHAADDDG